MEEQRIITVTPEQQALMDKFYNYLKDAIANPGVGAYEGGLVAPLDWYEQAARGLYGPWRAKQQSNVLNAPGVQTGLNAFVNAARQYAPFMNEAKRVARAYAWGTPVVQEMPRQWENYFQQGVAEPTWNEFDRSVNPRIREAFAGTGSYWGSPRANAQRNAIEQTQKNITEQRGKGAMQWQQLGQQLAGQLLPASIQSSATFMNALPTALQTVQPWQQSPIIAAQTLANLGQMNRQVDQAKLTAEFQDWLRTRPYMDPRLEYALAFAGTPTMATVAQPSSGSPWPFVAGAGLNLLGTALMR